MHTLKVSKMNPQAPILEDPKSASRDLSRRPHLCQKEGSLGPCATFWSTRSNTSFQVTPFWPYIKK